MLKLQISSTAARHGPQLAFDLLMESFACSTAVAYVTVYLSHFFSCSVAKAAMRYKGKP